MTKIKLCGMFRDIDIDYLNASPPDYAGFILTPGYRRSVTADQAARMRARLDPSVQTVGVFVNERITAITDIVRQGTIDLVQLHGDEDEEYICAFKAAAGVPVIKAVRVRTAADIEAWQNSAADFLLLDAYSDKSRGGTGEGFDHSLAKSKKPFFLAGGITPGNAEQAAGTVRPYALDVSSGIETDGVKDKDKITDIVRRIRNV